MKRGDDITERVLDAELDLLLEEEFGAAPRPELLERVRADLAEEQPDRPRRRSWSWRWAALLLLGGLVVVATVLLERATDRPVVDDDQVGDEQIGDEQIDDRAGEPIDERRIEPVTVEQFRAMLRGALGLRVRALTSGQIVFDPVQPGAVHEFSALAAAAATPPTLDRLAAAPLAAAPADDFAWTHAFEVVLADDRYLRFSLDPRDGDWIEVPGLGDLTIDTALREELNAAVRAAQSASRLAQSRLLPADLRDLGPEFPAADWDGTLRLYGADAEVVRSLAGSERLRELQDRLRAVDLSGSVDELGLDALAVLRDLPAAVERVVLRGARIDERSLRQLVGLRNVRDLDLGEPRLSGNPGELPWSLLLVLADGGIRRLDLSGWRVADAALFTLRLDGDPGSSDAELELVLDRSQFGPELLRAVRDIGRRLVSLRFAGCEVGAAERQLASLGIGGRDAAALDRMLEALQAFAASLRHLDLSGPRGWSDAALAELLKHVELESLRLDDIELGEAVSDALVEHGATLRELGLCSSNGQPLDGWIMALKGLQRLDLRGRTGPGTSIYALSCIDALVDLDVRGCPGVDHQTVANARAAFPRLRIRWDPPREVR